MKKLVLFAAAFIALSMSFASCSSTTEKSGESKSDTTVVTDSADTTVVDSAVVVDSVK